MPEPSVTKPIPSALTDPMLNAARGLGLKVDPRVVNSYDNNRQMEYQSKIGNVTAVNANAPIVDLASVYRQLPQEIQKGADLIERKTISKAETTVAKAAGVVALRKAEIIGANLSNKVIKGIYSGAKAYLGNPDLAFGTAAGLVSFNPVGFAKGIGKSIGMEVSGLGPVDKALTAGEIGAAATGTLGAYHAALRGGAAAIGGAVDYVAGAIGSVKLPTAAAIFTPITTGNDTIDGNAWRMKDYNAYQTAQYERWKEQDDRFRQQRIEDEKKLNLQRVNDSMSSTGFKDDHISAYFKNK